LDKSQSAARVREAGSGVPDGGEAGLEVELVLGLGDELVELVQGFDEVRMVAFVAECLEGHDGVLHGGVDGAEAVGVAAAFEDPAFGLAYGGDAGVAVAVAFPEAEELVDLVEDGGQEFVALGEGEFFFGVDEFFDGDALGGGADAADGLDDGEGDDDGACPGGHLIEHAAHVERAAGEQDQFRRDGGDVLAWVEAEEAEVDFCIAVAGLEAAEGENFAARAA
jgi:hypothetical protein